MLTVTGQFRDSLPQEPESLVAPRSRRTGIRSPFPAWTGVTSIRLMFNCRWASSGQGIEQAPGLFARSEKARPAGGWHLAAAPQGWQAQRCRQEERVPVSGHVIESE